MHLTYKATWHYFKKLKLPAQLKHRNKLKLSTSNWNSGEINKLMDFPYSLSTKLHFQHFKLLFPVIGVFKWSELWRILAVLYLVPAGKFWHCILGGGYDCLSKLRSHIKSIGYLTISYNINLFSPLYRFSKNIE